MAFLSPSKQSARIVFWNRPRAGCSWFAAHSTLLILYIRDYDCWTNVEVGPPVPSCDNFGQQWKRRDNAFFATFKTCSARRQRLPCLFCSFIWVTFMSSLYWFILLFVLFWFISSSCYGCCVPPVRHGQRRCTPPTCVSPVWWIRCLAVVTARTRDIILKTNLVVQVIKSCWSFLGWHTTQNGTETTSTFHSTSTFWFCWTSLALLLLGLSVLKLNLVSCWQSDTVTAPEPSPKLLSSRFAASQRSRLTTQLRCSVVIRISRRAVTASQDCVHLSWRWHDASFEDFHSAWGFRSYGIWPCVSE